MKVGLVSDVHNNVATLTYALDDLSDCDLLLGLGDLVSDYRVDSRIVRLVSDWGLLNIAGNHEKSILLQPGSQTRAGLPTETLQLLKDLPAAREIALDGRRVHVAHGAPWDDPTDYRCVHVIERDRQNSSASSRRRKPISCCSAIRIESWGARPGHARAQPWLLRRTPRPQRLTFAKLDGTSGLASVFIVMPGQNPEPLLQADF